MPDDLGPIDVYTSILLGDSARSALAGEFIGAMLYGTPAHASIYMHSPCQLGPSL